MQFIIKKFDELTTKELYAIAKLRSEVFVLEQQCLYLDLDDKDYESLHLYFKINDEIIAYCRILPKNLSFENIGIGRVLTKKTYRKQGIARQLLLKTIDYIHNNLHEDNISIAAQYYLKDFYKSLGFKIVSDIYLDDGIEHINMLKSLKI